MNAYARLVPDKDRTLTSAGCIVLSSVVPNLMRGETSCGNTLENIVSVVSASVKARIVKLEVIPTQRPDDQKRDAGIQVLGFSTVWRGSPSLGFGLG
jgi:hypothetical protein